MQKITPFLWFDTLKDKYGLSWQVVPAEIEEWLTDPDPERVQRVMDAVMTMKKLDIATLKRAHDSVLAHR